MGWLIPDCEQRMNAQITRMKTIKILLGIGLLTAMTCFAGEVSEADQKWSKVVEAKIVEGATTISTPSEARVKLAKELAQKHQRQCRVEKTDKGYRVVVEAAKHAQTAAK